MLNSFPLGREERVQKRKRKNIEERRQGKEKGREIKEDRGQEGGRGANERVGGEESCSNHNNANNRNLRVILNLPTTYIL